MNSKLFREDMTYAEAQKVLFSSIRENMNREEISRIREEYAAIVPVLMDREFAAAPPGRLTSHPL